jgi:prephenate dehydrogenase
MVEESGSGKAFRVDKAAVLGVGLIGGSVAQALLKTRAAGQVIGLFRREETLRTALENRLVSRGTMSMKEAVSGAGAVIIAASVETIGALAGEAARYLERDALVTDVGSVKAPVVESVSKALTERQDVLFAGSHPLYGSHLSGPAAGAALDPAGRLCVVTPAARRKNAEAAAAKVEALWRAIGMRTLKMDAQDHDRLVAFSSHLPHVAAAVLARTLPEAADALAASGFLDTTRVASGPAHMWAEILCLNREAVLKALGDYQEDLELFKKALLAQDGAAVEKFLSEAAEARARVAARSTRE